MPIVEGEKQDVGRAKLLVPSLDPAQFDAIIQQVTDTALLHGWTRAGQSGHVDRDGRTVNEWFVSFRDTTARTRLTIRVGKDSRPNWTYYRGRSLDVCGHGLEKVLAVLRREEPLPPPPHRVLGVKDLARRAVRDAIRSGRLVRPSKCQLCRRHKDHPDVLAVKGFHAQAIQADHANYERPLEVAWLCIACHQGFSQLVYLRVRWARKAGRPEGWPWWCWLCRKNHHCRRMTPTGIHPRPQEVL